MQLRFCSLVAQVDTVKYPEKIPLDFSYTIIMTLIIQQLFYKACDG